MLVFRVTEVGFDFRYLHTELCDASICGLCARFNLQSCRVRAFMLL